MPTLYVTAPPDAVEDLARGVVEEQLAACVNVVDCRSIYRWDDSVHDDDESILLVKTTDDAAERCREWLEAEHPYDVPCIEQFEAENALPAFTEWRADVVE